MRAANRGLLVLACLAFVGCALTTFQPRWGITMPGDTPEGHDEASAGAVTFADETVDTLLREEDLRRRAAAGDREAAGRVSRANAELAALREKATAGDVDAALALSGTLNLGGRNDAALNVLRIPAVRDNPRIQAMLAQSLVGHIGQDIRNCRPVNPQELRELLELHRAGAVRGEHVAERYVETLAGAPKGASTLELAAHLLGLETLPTCDNQRPRSQKTSPPR